MDQVVNKNRLLGSFLFGLAGLIVWSAFVLLGGSSSGFNSETFIGALSAVLSAIIVSFWFSPKIYISNDYQKPIASAFGFGVLITLLSYFLGSFFFSISSIISISSGFLKKSY